MTDSEVARTLAQGIEESLIRVFAKLRKDRPNFFDDPEWFKNKVQANILFLDNGVEIDDILGALNNGAVDTHLN